MQHSNWAMIAINSLLFGALLLLLDAQGASLITKGDWEYQDLVAVLLAVVSIMVTFIGIIIAVAAIWGFQTLKSMAEAKAVETSKLGSETFLKSDEFQGTLKSEIQAAIQSSARDAVQDALAPLIVKNDDGVEHQGGDEEWVD